MNKSQVKTKEDLEEYYKTCRKIKLGILNYTPKSPEEVFQNVFEGESTTYSKGGRQCDERRARSIDDCIKAIKFYYPNKTLKEVIEVIRSTMHTESYNGNYANLGYCSTIRKNNFHKTRYKPGEYNMNFFNNVSFNRQGFNNCNITMNEV